MVKNSCLEMQKGIWDEKGDGKTIPFGSRQHGTGNWATFSKRSAAGQRRSGKLVREKCSNNSHQKVDPRQKSFTPQEEDLVIQLHAAIGSRWPIIAQQFPGKTEHDVKVLWNSKLRKKLSSMGIDPVTHKPFSQILADYGNIGAFPKPARARYITPLSNDLKNQPVFSPSDHDRKGSQALNSTSNFLSSSSSSPIDLYSQLQAVSFITEASNYMRAKHTATRAFEKERSLVGIQESAGFNWGDCLLEDSFSGEDGVAREKENDGAVVEMDENPEGRLGADGGKNGICFEGSMSSSSNGSSSFVDAMFERQDAMFSDELSCFSEEPFYY